MSPSRARTTLLPPALLPAVALAAMGLAAGYLALTGHLVAAVLPPGATLVRLLAAALAAAGVAHAWLRRERAAAGRPLEGRRLLSLPRRAAFVLGGALGAFALGAILTLADRVPTSILVHTLLSAALVPGALAGLATYLALEDRVARLLVVEAPPPGLLVPRRRLRARLMVSFAAVALLPLLLLGAALYHALGHHDDEHAGAPVAVDAEAAAEHNHAILLRLLLVVGAGAVALGMGALAARSLLRPVLAMTATMERIRGGDSGARVPIITEDELGRAAELLNAMAVGLAERAQLQEAFGRYVSPEVADALRGGRLMLAGERREVSVLFADIRGFTVLSHGLSPEEVLGFVNAYLEEMIAEVVRFGGRLDKVMGDEIMVVFGAPLADPDHARHAVQAALAIRERLARYNEGRRGPGGAAIRLAMGIHSGPAVAGSVGCELYKLEYTVLGDTVNVASRMEGLAKRFDRDLLVSEATWAQVPGLDAEALPPAEVAGKSEPLRAFAVRAVSAAVDAA